MCQAYALAESHGIIFNYRKTVCMTFESKSTKSAVITLLPTLISQNVILVNYYKYLGNVLDTELSDDKTLRDKNCDINMNIVQQTSCEPHSQCSNAVKINFFIPFVCPSHVCITIMV